MGLYFEVDATFFVFIVEIVKLLKTGNAGIGEPVESLGRIERTMPLGRTESPQERVRQLRSSARSTRDRGGLKSPLNAKSA